MLDLISCALSQVDHAAYPIPPHTTGTFHHCRLMIWPLPGTMAAQRVVRFTRIAVLSCANSFCPWAACETRAKAIATKQGRMAIRCITLSEGPVSGAQPPNRSGLRTSTSPDLLPWEDAGWKGWLVCFST